MWNKLGLIFDKCHAQLPTVEVMDEFLRVYYSTRICGKSHIYYFDVAGDDPSKVIKEGNCVLRPGNRGLFDDSGVMPSSILSIPPAKYMFYTGWNLDKGQVPYGHGISFVEKLNSYSLENNWKKQGIGPILDRTTYTPYLCNSAFVVRERLGLPDWEKDTDGYRMYYCRGDGWIKDFPTYGISMAISNNLRGPWKHVGSITGDNGMASSRPCITTINGVDHLFFSEKGINTPYKIHCYKQKSNGWEIMEDIIPLSPKGWDSDMVCYPYVVHWNGKIYMFYNGNGYGSTGIGLAECLDI